jgi:hypothetical protein
MEIVLGTLEFGAIGGAATYVMTVAEQLQLLGHGVTIFASDVGELAETAELRGIRVAGGEGALPNDCDAVYAQDAPSAYLLTERFPGRPQAFCMHAGPTEFNRWLPPQLPGVVGAVVVLHDRSAQQAAALGHREEIVRLRQPVDLNRFAPRAPLAEPPQRALLLGNQLDGDRRELVIRACERAGLGYMELGRHGGQSSVGPEREINLVDIVIGEGRVIVEAMACGRPAFVYGRVGGDGWVTPDSYATQEAVNFTGVTETGTFATADTLEAQLRGYRRSMGINNRDLARLHHSASRHAEEVVGLLERLAPGRPPADAPLREFARMSRVQWHAESRALGSAFDARQLSSRLQDAEARAEVAEAEVERLRSWRWLRRWRRWVR